MSNLYPLKPVISSSRELAHKYNESMASVMLTSACLTPDEASKLLSEGAVFNQIVLVNGDGEQLPSQIGDPNNWDNEVLPTIKRVSLDTSAPDAIKKLHRMLNDKTNIVGMG